MGVTLELRSVLSRILRCMFVIASLLFIVGYCLFRNPFSGGGKIVDYKEVQINPQVMKSYVGKYVSKDIDSLVITIEDGILYVTDSENNIMRLYGKAEDIVFVKEMYGKGTFQRNEKNEVTGMMVQTSNGITFYKKK